MNDSEISKALFDASLTILEQCKINDEMFDVAVKRMKERGCQDLVALKAVSTVAQTLNKVHGTQHKPPTLKVLQ